jgi:hypothetical protein
VSDAEVTRDGPTNVRPGREARMWTGVDGGRGGPRGGPRDHPGSSYYGMSIINPPVWEELDIAGYLFAGGLAGGSSLIAAGAELTGRPRLAARAELAASGAIAVSLAALIHDLGRPARFINMLRVFKPTSPMSVGTWILAAYSPLNLAASASAVTGIGRPLGRGAAIGAGVLGSAVATYTAALISNTAVPVWHEGFREMPFLFAGSAISAAAGLALAAAPVAESGPARTLAVLGATTELLAEELLERRLGSIAEAAHDGTAGRRLTAAKALTAVGAAGALTLGRRNRLAAAAAGAGLVLGSACVRFGLFAAGMASAQDPKYTVTPQRERLDRRAG